MHYLKNQNYLTDYVRLWINLFVTFTGRFVAYPVFNMFAQYVRKILPILSSAHVATLTHYFSDILCDHIKHTCKSSHECTEQIDP